MAPAAAPTGSFIASKKRRAPCTILPLTRLPNAAFGTSDPSRPGRTEKPDPGRQTPAQSLPARTSDAVVVRYSACPIERLILYTGYGCIKYQSKCAGCSKRCVTATTGMRQARSGRTRSATASHKPIPPLSVAAAKKPYPNNTPLRVSRKDGGPAGFRPGEPGHSRPRRCRLWVGRAPL